MQTIEEVRVPWLALGAKMFKQFIKATERSIMKKETIVITVLLSLCCLRSVAAVGYETYDIPTNLTKNISMDEKNALQLLIHINWVASRISHKETVLEDEYNQINVSNLDLSYLKDEDAVGSLKSLSTAITNARKKHGDLKMAEHVKDTQLKNAFFSSAPNPVAIISKDWRAMAFVAVQAAFSWFMNYQAIKREVKLQYEQELWRLERDDMENVNTFYNEMLDHQTRIVTRYKIDDMFRVTDGDFRRLTRYLEEMDDKGAYDMLCLNQKRYMLSAFYWYHRGVLAYKLKDYNEAMKCFRTFQRIHVPFIRRDKMAALVAQGIIELLGKTYAPDKKEIEYQMRIIEKNAQPEDWELHYFAATVYFDFLNDYVSAEKSVKKAIGHLTLLYKRDLTDYLQRLAAEKKLPYVKWWKHRKENVPPSSENLAQCRAFLFQILSKGNAEQVTSHVEYFWKQDDVSDMERLLMATCVSNTNCAKVLNVGLTSGANFVKSDRLSNEDGETLCADVCGIYVDYDFNDEFWVYIPLRWVYLMPKDITFSLYGIDGTELYCANERWPQRKVVIRNKKPVLAIEIDTDGAKKYVEESSVYGFSLNFKHPSFCTRVYVKEFDNEPSVRKWDSTKLPRAVVNVAFGLFPLEVLAWDTASVMLKENDTCPKASKLGELQIIQGGKEQVAPASIMRHIMANESHREIKSDNLYGFLISCENAYNGTCTAIDFTSLLESQDH